MIKGKNILITGGTGSLGQAITKKLLSLNPKTIRIFSRDEDKQHHMKENLQDSRLRFLIGDVRDKERLGRAMEEIDIVIHAAALKHIDVGEYNPFEFIKTNIYGSQNVVDSAMDENVDVCLAVSTDKAVSPLNLYGATKLAMEKLFIAANSYKGKRKTKFCCVRYGNVFGSRGSVIPKFIEQIRNKKLITITDPTMTRFDIEMDDALDLILNALKMTHGGEVFIPKLLSYKLGDLVDALSLVSRVNFKLKSISTREGEKHHEILLNKYEIKYAIEINDLYILLNTQNFATATKNKLYPKSRKLQLDVYSSDNVSILPKNILVKKLKKFNFIP